jgi:hypothetical protein
MSIWWMPLYEHLVDERGGWSLHYQTYPCCAYAEYQCIACDTVQTAPLSLCLVLQAVLQGLDRCLLSTSVHVPDQLSDSTEVPDTGTLWELYGSRGLDFIVDVGTQVVTASTVSGEGGWSLACHRWSTSKVLLVLRNLVNVADGSQCCTLPCDFVCCFLRLALHSLRCCRCVQEFDVLQVSWADAQHTDLRCCADVDMFLCMQVIDLTTAEPTLVRQGKGDAADLLD